LATLPRGMDGKQAARTKRRDAGFSCIRRLGACATALPVYDSFARMRQVCARTTALSYRASPGAVQQRPVGRRSGASRRAHSPCAWGKS